MIDFLTTEGLVPFSTALGIVLGLLILELVAALSGFSFISSEADGPDIDLDADFDLDGPDLDFDGPDLDVDIDTDAAPGISGGGLLGWLGIGKVPVAIWVASALTGFGVSGVLLQSMIQWITGLTLPSALAVPLAIAPAVFFAKVLSVQLARIVPKTESSALNARNLAGAHGVISQGTARRGSPAEVRVKDRHGNTHYLRLEPYEDEAELVKGAEVYVTRMADGALRLMETTTD